MREEIATFPLRNSSNDQLTEAVTRMLFEFMLWESQATAIAGYHNDAKTAGVTQLVQDRVDSALRWSIDQGIVVLNDKGSPEDPNKLIAKMVEQQLSFAEQAMKVSIIVNLHNAFEKFVWRCTRLALVLPNNRSKVVEKLGTKKFTVSQLSQSPADDLIDDVIEKWWHDLDRGESIVEKWNTLIWLAGYPKQLSDEKWKFDHELLQTFDNVRNNAVHHDGTELKKFDLDEFRRLLSRVPLVWCAFICQALGVKVDARSLVKS